jgi:hypothetical protein
MTAAQRLAGTLLLMLTLMQPRQASALGRWTCQAEFFAGEPVAAAEFSDGWKYGLGLGGGVSRALTSRFELGLAADFVEFKLANIPDAAESGGQRRFSRLELPLRYLAWQHDGFHRTQLVVQAGAGYVHESIDPISGGLAPGRPFRSDGKSIEAGAWISRLLYQHTRWFIGGRYTRLDLPDHKPEYWTFQVGARMPLEGSRPR